MLKEKLKMMNGVLENGNYQLGQFQLVELWKIKIYLKNWPKQNLKRNTHVKKYTERKDGIKSVTLVIDAYNGRKLEIPLEVWQVDVIREMLGLRVDTTNLDTYCMRSKEQTDENMKIYHHLLRKSHNEE